MCCWTQGYAVDDRSFTYFRSWLRLKQAQPEPDDKSVVMVEH